MNFKKTLYLAAVTKFLLFFCIWLPPILFLELQSRHLISSSDISLCFMLVYMIVVNILLIVVFIIPLKTFTKIKQNFSHREYVKLSLFQFILLILSFAAIIFYLLNGEQLVQTILGPNQSYDYDDHLGKTIFTLIIIGAGFIMCGMEAFCQILSWIGFIIKNSFKFSFFVTLLAVLLCVFYAISVFILPHLELLITPIFFACMIILGIFLSQKEYKTKK